MKKFIRNICAISLGAAMMMSGCAEAPLESNFSYPADYEVKEPTTEATIIENADGFMGNTGDVAINSGDTYAVIRVADYGDIKVKLFPEAAPYAVQNFIDLANSGYYEGKTFHRVIEDFMIQGGSLNGDGTGGTDSNGGSFRNEINPKMRHFYGALCYASAMGDNSCQFYIVNHKQPVEDASLQYEAYKEYYSAMAEQYKTMQADYEESSPEYQMIKIYVSYYEEAVQGLEAMLDSADDTVNVKYASGGVPFLDGGYTVFGQTVEGFEIIDAITGVEVTAGSDGAESKPVEDVVIESVTIMLAE